MTEQNEIPPIEQMTARDRIWYEKYLQVKEIGLKNLQKGTPLYNWVKRQHREWLRSKSNPPDNTTN
jgi:hypothetical protein